MKKFFETILILVYAGCVHGQVTFKSGWNTYKAGSLIHEYTYTCYLSDSIRLFPADSAMLFTSADSLVTMTMRFCFQDKSVYKTTNYLNMRKQVLKSEEYRDDNLVKVTEWKYDDKNRKIYCLEEDKINDKSTRNTYDYAHDKKSGETVVTESSYVNGKIEFYTKAYYDKNSVKQKEVRYNDNNKDIVHIESYTYGDNGKVKERTVYFPEWKVTKKFQEKEGSEIPKCFKTLPVGSAEKINLNTRVPYIRRLVTRNQPILSDKECHDFEYKFSNYNNCEITISNTNINNGKKVVFMYKEKF